MVMDSIYANSYCTIVAADGKSADYGLPGVPSGSKTRSVHQVPLNFPGCDFLEYSGRGNTTPYCETRAWIFQELHLSRRCIVFQAQSVFWSCQEASFDECIPSKPDGTKFPHADPIWRRPSTDTMDLEAWAQLVMKYNSTSLTNPADAHAAFIGIENILRPQFPGNFTYGLPEYFFDFAILWQPSYPLTRRGETEHLFPTWSWLAWEGILDVIGKPEYTTEPVVQWAQNQADRVPNSGGLATSSDKAEHDTSHNSLLDKLRDQMSTVSRQSIIRDDWLPILRVYAQSATFLVSGKGEMGFNRSIAMPATITDLDGNYAGVLFLNRKHSDDAPEGAKCKLIAISKGTMTRDIPSTEASGATANTASDDDADSNEANDYRAPDWKDFLRLHKESLRSRESKTIRHSGRGFESSSDRNHYNYYNVFWIMRDDEKPGPTYVREACGRVEKDVWERQRAKTEEIWLC
ncbi:hypothetical protein F5Y12DRAFT_714454 [Xylaria sp. FL1777]|nr:hypothetical protein F5Y12DRAFT_714454 [Xylaria sp. FL1777]